MPMLGVILLVLLNAASAAVLVYWGVGLLRLIGARLLLPTARAGVKLAAGMKDRPGVCVVVPAHNEQEAIGPLVSSLLAQDYPALRVVLCLDRCADETAERARALIKGDPRFTVLEIESCPPDWAGKVNAVWRGVRSAPAGGADLLLFADADTIFHPSCVSATAALLEHRGLDLLSLLSTLTSGAWFERIAQPAAGLELVRQHPMMRANRRRGRRRPFANGQFMLFRREAYDAIGGHEAVKDELLEDLALARNMAEAGRATGLLLADGMLTCRMYESWEQFRSGWKRIYTESAKCKVSRLRKAAWVTLLFGTVLPAACLAGLLIAAALLSITIADASPALQREARVWGIIGAWLSGAGLVAYASVVMATYRIGRVPLWAAAGFPLGSRLVSGILFEAASDLRRGVPTKWGGREYTRKAR